MTETKQHRGHNEGSIYQTAEGKWRGAVYLGVSQDGKPLRKYVSGRTKADVRNQVKEILAVHDRGLPVATKSQTVQQFLDGWLRDVVLPSERPTTYESYASVVRTHLIPALGRHKLENLTAQHIQKMLNERKDAGLSGRTLMNIRAILRAALNQALRWDLVFRNVATLTDPPRLEPFEAKPLSPPDALKFLQATKGDRLEAMYALTVWLGLRQGEVFGLRWDDVDLERGALKIRKQLQYRRLETINALELKKLPGFDRERVEALRASLKGKIATATDAKERASGEKALKNAKLPFLVDPKTEQSKRQLPLPKPVADALKAHRKAQLEEQLLAGRYWMGKEWGLVFCSTIGTPLDPSNVTKQYRVIMKSAGIEQRRFHDLRHSCGTFLTSRNVHPRVVMQILGHSQISTTMNTYSHVDLETMSDALDAITDLFESDKRSS